VEICGHEVRTFGSVSVSKDPGFKSQSYLITLFIFTAARLVFKGHLVCGLPGSFRKLRETFLVPGLPILAEV
jgi:hypothetical protein